MIGNIGLDGTRNYSIVGTIYCGNAQFKELTDGESRYATRSWVSSNFADIDHGHAGYVNLQQVLNEIRSALDEHVYYYH